jgi:hypothetical protein
LSEISEVEKAERVFVNTIGQAEEKLEEGWKFDPWLSPRGLPTIIANGEMGQYTDLWYYWVLVKGTPEQVVKLNPFIELPEEDAEEETQPAPNPVGYATIFLEHAKEPPQLPPGYAILHQSHIYSKGTVYTQITKEPEESTTSEDSSP